MLNAAAIFLFTFVDSFCGCMQVLNLVHGRKIAAFLASVALGSSKVAAIVLVVKSTTPATFIAYILGGAVGAQCSLRFRHRYVKAE